MVEHTDHVPRVARMPRELLPPPRPLSLACERCGEMVPDYPLALRRHQERHERIDARERGRERERARRAARIARAARMRQINERRTLQRKRSEG